MVEYFQENYVDGVGLSFQDFTFNNFNDFLTRLIHEELLFQTFRQLSLYEVSGGTDEPLLDFDKSGEVEIMWLKMKNEIWQEHLTNLINRNHDRLFAKISKKNDQ